jgi:hypothetical protein
MKEEGGGSISPQYLNDIEHDRRSPSSGHQLRQFSCILNIPEDYSRVSRDLTALRFSASLWENFRGRLKWANVDPL